jgi:hypothetical protein
VLGRLAGLLVLVLALSGHTRRAEVSPAAVVATLAQVLVERDGAVVARGSAVAIAERQEGGEPACYLLTVGHVVASGDGWAANVVVVLPGEDGPHRLPGELVRQVDVGDRDLAVLRTVASGCRPAQVGAPIELGADVWLAGFAAEDTPRIWGGHVREMPRVGGMRFTVDGVATEGTSGGGVFDVSTGRLLGLIQGYWTVRLIGPSGRVGGEAPAGTTAVVPISAVRALMEEWGVEDLLDATPASP